jgi:hypothetical protein
MQFLWATGRMEVNALSSSGLWLSCSQTLRLGTLASSHNHKAQQLLQQLVLVAETSCH